MTIDHPAQDISSVDFASRQDRLPRGLLVSHRGTRCGVYQFGRRLFDVLATGGGIDWHYAECGDLDEMMQVEETLQPDVILLNYHPATLAWALDSGRSRAHAVIFSVFHEAHQAAADALMLTSFDYLLCPDPTLLPRNPIALPVPRFIPSLLTSIPASPDPFTVGSFGFATPGKGFEFLCRTVNAQFDTARIRINIPFHDLEVLVPREQLDAIISGCHREVTKPGITLNVTHDFMEEPQLLDFLAQNTINAFLYEGGVDRGISSCTDYALASGRPIAVSRSPMFRHLHGLNPSICIEDRTLRSIAESGTNILRDHRAAYAAPAAGAAWNSAILGALAQRTFSHEVPDHRGFNKILDDRSRDGYQVALSDLALHAPAMLARKIERANIQQAFALDAVERFAASMPEARILAVGSFEDTAVATLRAKGFVVDEIDPNVNDLDLEAFYRSPQGTVGSYDIILCVSVLEHVEDDRQFVRMVGDLLAPRGVAVFTVDFSNAYPSDGTKPAADVRLYTSDDLRNRLMSAIPDCGLFDYPSWDDGGLDFEYEGSRYAFASWVFHRLGIPISKRGRVDGEPSWKEQLRVGAHRANKLAAEVFSAKVENESLTDACRNFESQIANYESQLAAAIARERALTGPATQLHKLVRELRWPDGPRSLRVALPLARLVRRVSGTRVPAVLPGESAESAATTAVSARIPGLAPTPPPQTASQSFRRRLMLSLYHRVRPVIRPIAWRTRTFLTREIRQELTQLDELLRLLLANQGIAAGPARSPVWTEPGADAQRVDLHQFEKMLEITLLTLALDRERR